MAEPNSEHIVVRMPADLRVAIERVAAEERRTRSACLRILLADAIAARRSAKAREAA